ncbi:MAG: ABC transporter ATP-binding protein [Prevotella sp.]|nr:ABC transporter ATP-binding protein [Prevotella sp.]
MIKISDLKYRYSGMRRYVFDGFNLELNDNTIYGLLGKNGTGKSTLLYLISGLLRQKGGSITFDGSDTSKHYAEILRETFLVPEEFEVLSMKLDTYVKIHEPFYPNFSHQTLESCLRDFELPYDVNMKELSMGQKKKVYMSFALAANTRLLLMDEPTNGLDIPSKSQFRKVIANNMSEERMMIISTHQVHDVENLLDHILILDNTQLLVNTSVSDICEKYNFEYRTLDRSTEDVLYSEPSPMGNAVITRKETGDADTQLNLELLFNAVTKKEITL